jgi:serine/threonine-protein kinase
MEFIDGPGLNVLVNNKSSELEGRRMPLIRQMAQAVQAVHDAGFIHRDICPRNFICSRDLSTLKLIDFGLAVPATPEFMQPGNRTGTPLYMAPEIVRRRATDKRVDIFALGVTVYRLCTFEYPWPGADATGKGALTHDTHEPVSILKFRPNLDPALAKAIHACIAPQPAQRPDSAEQFLKMIRNVEVEERAA